jgi:small subunit ribosomal protein S16
MLKIRLRRMGSTHRPFYRVIVSDSRRVPTGGTALEELGWYDPRQNPARIELQADRIDHWVSSGAQLSPTVAKLLASVRSATA